MRIKILARKNLKMSSGKLAAQAVHAALALPAAPHHSVVVLEVSDKKFEEAKIAPCDLCLGLRNPTTNHVQFCFLCDNDINFNFNFNTGMRKVVVITDAGYTEVAPHTETVLAFYEPDPREEKKNGEND